MQGSVQKRRTEIALWEMDQPDSKRPRKNGRKRQGDVDIIDLYQGREIRPVRTRRPEQSSRINRPAGTAGRSRTAEPDRRSRTVEPIWQGRAVEPVRRSRAAEPVRRNREAAEPVRRNRRVDRAVEPVRRRRPVEEDWDVELIGQDRMV